MSQIKLNQITARIHENICLEDLTLCLQAEQCWAFIGSNGCGKTAFGRLLCGQLEIISGSAQLPSATAFISFEKVTEALDHERNIDDSEFMGGADSGTSARDFILQDQVEKLTELERLAQTLNFTHLLERGIKFLSTGEMRKAVICQALLQNPQLIVLDEPFDGLDSAARTQIIDIIRQALKDGIQVVMLLNRFNEILPEVSHIGYLHRCRLIASDTKSEILASPEIERLHHFQINLPDRLPQLYEENSSIDRTEPLIRMRKVSVSYSGKPILNRIDWQVMPLEHWMIIGPNGSGKSTLLSLINGDNTQAYANDICIFGRQKGQGESVWELKKHIGYISTSFQREYRVGGSVLSVLISGFFDSIGIYRKPEKEHMQVAQEWLSILKMENKSKKQFRSLSFGEQRLVLIARAMIKLPRLLILDEPCQGLDTTNLELILGLIDYIGRTGKTTLLYVTHHDEDSVPCISNRLQLIPNPDLGTSIQCSRIGNIANN
ncbi:molybdate ABC transporter ATP-binding protein ModF [Verrucomicrobia bacterium]|nr:molybdate ABC transporter ATP-binding protein ModF [Verrucomicrobiota bacterium]